MDDVHEAIAAFKQMSAEDPFSLPAITAGNKMQDYWVRLALGIAQNNTRAVRDALNGTCSYREAKTLRALLAEFEVVEERVGDRVDIFNKQAASVETLKVAMLKLGQLGENV